MAGKHRKRSQVRSKVAKRGGTGLAAAAVGATSVTTAIVTGATPTIAPGVDLMALVTPANSTAQIFAGTTYYGTDYEDEYGPQQVVPFLLGPQGIANAIAEANASEPTAVLASGWGAGQTGTALGQMDPSDYDEVDIVILDNDSNFPAGGFWTTYKYFAPFLLTSNEPTPNDLPVGLLDTAYLWNVNSNAVTYPANVVSDVNSLVAYAYGYGGEQTAVLPDENLEPGYHYVVDQNTGKVIAEYDLNDPKYGERDAKVTATYVTFVNGVTVADDGTFVYDDVPVLRPIRLIPGGDIIAETFEPAVLEVVKAGYKDNQPIPEDPTVQRPMGLGLAETTTAIKNLPGAIQQGLQDGAATAQEDIAKPTNFITKPLGEVARLPLISTLTNADLATNNTGTPSLTSKNRALTGGGPLLSGFKKPSLGSTTDRPRPLKQFSERVNEAVNRVTGGLQKDKTENDKD